ncbi:MAG: TlpA family protein disulfide reductase [Chloroflexi bacterium]|nr:TlpA family protein disulfide reductase [Chloroflexota bacterium]
MSSICSGIRASARAPCPRRPAFFAMLILLLLAPVFGAGCRAAASDRSGVSPDGKRPDPAIDFTLPGLDGKNVTLGDLKGKVVLINFWTTWCPACRDEMPLLQAAYDEQRSSGLVVLGVDLKEDRATVEKFLKGNGLSFPVVLDAKGEVSSKYNVYYIPHSVIVDRDGNMRRVKVGAFSSKGEILDAVRPLLAAGG